MPAFKREKHSDRVIIREEVVSVSDLQRAAHKASMRFWTVLLTLAMVSSMIVPYLSLAASSSVSESNSAVWNSDIVMPGYSTPGIKLNAYGIDLNAWARPSSPEVVGSTYGVWSGDRADAISHESSTDMASTADRNDPGKVNSTDRASIWKRLTGSNGYSQKSVDGSDRRSQSTSAADAVMPLRTAADFNYWDGQDPSSSANAAADIDVTLYPDFIVCAWKSGHATVLKSVSGNVLKDSAGNNDTIPLYIPLSSLFDAYGLNGRDATFNKLIDAIDDDSGSGFSPKLDAVVGNASRGKGDDLLHSTKYSDLNGGTGESSTAFNPYPYTMVFSKDGIVSSPYENSEAYVFFSPSSVYGAYIGLKSEYTQLAGKYSNEISAQSAVVTVRLGYYLSAMAIMEAYLEEALPQDMTRGYVGPTESNQVRVSDTQLGTFKGRKADELQKVPYSALMYDVANQITSGANMQSNADALMNTLSTFGYRNGIEKQAVGEESDEKGNLRLGRPMAGLSRAGVYNRDTNFTSFPMPTGSADEGTDEGNGPQGGDPRPISYDPDAMSPGNSGEQSTGMYVAPYFPIQQQKMPDSEKQYRFQIVSSVPYATLLSYIGQYGFSSSVALSYVADDKVSEQSQNDIMGLVTVRNALAGQLRNELDHAQNNDKNLSTYDTSSSVVLDPGNSVADTAEVTNDTNITQRIDQTLIHYSNNSLIASETRDMVDVIRATNGLRWETWCRYYNPLKSDGEESDIFITRVSPATTDYMPSAVLIGGYTCAGGESIDDSSRTAAVAFDFFSIPSLAPCLAHHSTTTNYYGALNYEMRFLYLKAFLKTISPAAKTPALAAYENYVTQTDEMEKDDKKEIKGMKQNIVGIYVYAKRLAWIRAWHAIKASDGESTVNGDMLNYVYTKVGNAGATDEAVIEQIKNKQDVKFQCGSIDGQVIIGITWDKQVAVMDESNGFGSIRPIKGELSKAADAIGDWWHSVTGQGGLGSDQTPVNDGKNQIDTDFLFSALYVTELDKLVDVTGKNKSGTYYWAPFDMVAGWASSGAVTPAPGNKSNAWASSELQSMWNVSQASNFTEREDTIGDLLSNDSAASDTENALNSYTAELFKSYNSMKKSIDTLLNAMPSQMMNCLAWADYQSASDSEAQYYTDPSEGTNVTVITTSDASDDDTGGDSDEETGGGTRNAAEAKAERGIDYDYSSGDGDTAYYSEVSDDDKEKADQQVNSKFARGVSNNTWLSTGQPACYTITATIGRVNNLAAQNNAGTSYPYVGIATGALMDGADRYALMEAHIVDYQGLANGISGDLSTRVRGSAVVIENPSYSNYTNFMDILNNVGAFICEATVGSIRLASDLFNESAGSITGSDNGASMPGTVTNFQEAQRLSSTANAAATLGIGDTLSMDARRALCNPDDYSGRTYDTMPLQHFTGSSVTRNGSGDVTGVSVGTGYDAPSNVSQASWDMPDRTASAASQKTFGVSNSDRSFSDALINGPMSSIYGFIQTLALSILMVELMIIAFTNFFAYSSAGDVGDDGAAAFSGTSMYQNRKTLVDVVPRAIIAVMMIGLPPLGGGAGFMGGSFYVLQLISYAIQSFGNILTNLDAGGIVNSITSVGTALTTSGQNIGTILVFALCGLVMTILFLIGSVCMLIQGLFLSLFYLAGPIVWAYYIWTYPIDSSKSVARRGKQGGGFLSSVGSRLNLLWFSGNQCGSEAAGGWFHGFLDVAALTLVWQLFFWVIGEMFSGAALSSMGADKVAQAAAGDASGLGGFFGLGDNLVLNMLIATLLALLLFYFMTKTLIDTVKGVAGAATAITTGAFSAVGKGLLGNLGRFAGNRMSDLNDKFGITDKAAGLAHMANAKLTEKVPQAAGLEDKASRMAAGAAGLAKSVRDSDVVRNTAPKLRDAGKNVVDAWKNGANAKSLESAGKALSDAGGEVAKSVEKGMAKSAAGRAKAKELMETMRDPSKSLDERNAALQKLANYDPVSYAKLAKAGLVNGDGTLDTSKLDESRDLFRALKRIEDDGRENGLTEKQINDQQVKMLNERVDAAERKRLQDAGLLMPPHAKGSVLTQAGRALPAAQQAFDDVLRSRARRASWASDYDRQRQEIQALGAKNENDLERKINAMDAGDKRRLISEGIVQKNGDRLELTARGKAMYESDDKALNKAFDRSLAIRQMNGELKGIKGTSDMFAGSIQQLAASTRTDTSDGAKAMQHVIQSGVEGAQAVQDGDIDKAAQHLAAELSRKMHTPNSATTRGSLQEVTKQLCGVSAQDIENVGGTLYNRDMARQLEDKLNSGKALTPSEQKVLLANKAYEQALRDRGLVKVSGGNVAPDNKANMLAEELRDRINGEAMSAVLTEGKYKPGSMEFNKAIAEKEKELQKKYAPQYDVLNGRLNGVNAGEQVLFEASGGVDAAVRQLDLSEPATKALNELRDNKSGIWDARTYDEAKERLRELEADGVLPQQDVEKIDRALDRRRALVTNQDASGHNEIADKALAAAAGSGTAVATSLAAHMQMRSTYSEDAIAQVGKVLHESGHEFSEYSALTRKLSAHDIDVPLIADGATMEYIASSKGVLDVGEMRDAFKTRRTEIQRELDQGTDYDARIASLQGQLSEFDKSRSPEARKQAQVLRKQISALRSESADAEHVAKLKACLREIDSVEGILGGEHSGEFIDALSEYMEGSNEIVPRALQQASGVDALREIAGKTGIGIGETGTTASEVMGNCMSALKKQGVSDTQQSYRGRQIQEEYGINEEAYRAGQQLEADAHIYDRGKTLQSIASLSGIDDAAKHEIGMIVRDSNVKTFDQLMHVVRKSHTSDVTEHDMACLADELDRLHRQKRDQYLQSLPPDERERAIAVLGDADAAHDEIESYEMGIGYRKYCYTEPRELRDEFRQEHHGTPPEGFNGDEQFAIAAAIKNGERAMIQDRIDASGINDIVKEAIENGAVSGGNKQKVYDIIRDINTAGDIDALNDAIDRLMPFIDAPETKSSVEQVRARIDDKSLRDARLESLGGWLANESQIKQRYVESFAPEEAIAVRRGEAVEALGYGQRRMDARTSEYDAIADVVANILFDPGYQGSLNDYKVSLVGGIYKAIDGMGPQHKDEITKLRSTVNEIKDAKSVGEIEQIMRRKGAIAQKIVSVTPMPGMDQETGLINRVPGMLGDVMKRMPPGTSVEQVIGDIDPQLKSELDACRTSGDGARSAALLSHIEAEMPAYVRRLDIDPVIKKAIDDLCALGDDNAWALSDEEGPDLIEQLQELAKKEDRSCRDYEAILDSVDKDDIKKKVKHFDDKVIDEGVRKVIDIMTKAFGGDAERKRIEDADRESRGIKPDILGPSVTGAGSRRGTSADRGKDA